MLIGLAARWSLRLEAGLCLYGHDLNESISPIEATLAWTISKRRREEGGFLGYEKVKDHLVNGVTKKRVGFEVQGKVAVREGAEIFTKSGDKVGNVTSGGPAPSLENKGIGMAYVATPHNKLKTELLAVVRGK
jgi:aminomethyltransferase